MVIFCTHCGTPVKLENARLSDPTYNVRCQQCRRLVVFAPARPASGSAGPKAPGPAPVSTSPSAPAAGAGGAVVAPTPEAQAAPADRTHYLQKIRLFSGLPFEECLLLESRLRPQEFAPQQAIVKEGGPGDAMFFITSGAVEVRKKDPNTGIDLLLTELKAGACFGEMALLTGMPRTASVVAVEPTTCSVLEQGAFDEVLLSSPKVSLAMSRVLAERLDEANQQLGVESMNLRKLQFDPRVLKLLPEKMIQQHKVLPVAFSNNRLTLAMVNSNNQAALEEVRRVIKGVMIEPVATSEDDFKLFMTISYPDLMKKEEERQAREPGATAVARASGEQPPAGGAPAAQPEPTASVIASLESEALKSLEVEESRPLPESVPDRSLPAEDTSIIRLANGVLSLAIKKGASDIHIEPQENNLAVRFRIDGALQQVQVLPKQVQMGLLSRLKILSKLDLAEKRLPQEGRISVRMDERPIDFSVSTLPTQWGEKVCLRVLDKSTAQLGLDKLILQPEVLKQVRDMIAQPSGVIYVTGPAGSGKTTTLYSALAELNDPDVNISTAEGRIECDLPNVNQVLIQEEIGLTFVRVLRAFLRQDSDVILVGETRDKETARLGVEAALTGRLVLTTLDTHDSAGACTRLEELGVDRFLLSSSTLGIVAQHLARRLCPACKQPYRADDISLKYLGLDPDKSITFYRHKGCDQCSGTGYRGRVGVYEALRINADLRRLLAEGASAKAIAETAAKNGMTTLKDYSIWLLENGWTTLEEILPVVTARA